MQARVVDYAFLIMIIVSSILAISIIVVPIWASIPRSDGTVVNYTIPTVVEEWGGVVVGFYFGSMLSVFLKYFEMARPYRSKDEQQLTSNENKDDA